MEKKIVFDYYYGAQADQFSFIRLPKMLITEEYFRELSSDAKILYGLLLDRMGLSIKNHWVDEQNRVYIIFTIEDVMENLCCSERKAVNLMGELDDKKGIGLLHKKRQGMGKPNLIYIKNFVIQKDYSYLANEPLEEIDENAPVMPGMPGYPRGIGGMTLDKPEPGSPPAFPGWMGGGTHTHGMADGIQPPQPALQAQPGQPPEMAHKTALQAPQMLPQMPPQAPPGAVQEQTRTVLRIKNCTGEQFKNCTDMQDVKRREMQPENRRNVQCNNTDLSNTDLSNTDPSIHPPVLPFPKGRSEGRRDGGMDGKQQHIDRFWVYKEFFESQIEYPLLIQEYDAEDVDGLVMLAVEAICSKKPSLRIAGEDYPQELVKAQLLKLNLIHMKYALRSLQENRARVTHVKNYILTVLFNAPSLMGFEAQARVNADRGENEAGWMRA